MKDLLLDRDLGRISPRHHHSVKVNKVVTAFFSQITSFPLGLTTDYHIPEFSFVGRGVLFLLGIRVQFRMLGF